MTISTVAAFLAGIFLFKISHIITRLKSKKLAAATHAEKKEQYYLQPCRARPALGDSHHFSCGISSKVVALMDCRTGPHARALGTFCNYCGVELEVKAIDGKEPDFYLKEKDARNLFDLINELEGVGDNGVANNPAAIRDDIAELKKRLEEKQNLLIELEVAEELRALPKSSD